MVKAGVSQSLAGKIKRLWSFPLEGLQKVWGWIRRSWKLVAIIAIIAAIVGAILYRRQQANQTVYTFVRPGYENLVKTLDVSGVVDADQKATLRFAAGGKLTYLGATEGAWVKKGQTIATIDQRELQKRLQQDLNAYTKERWDWENTQDATDYHVEGIGTRRSIDQQQADLANTVIDVEIRDIAISNTRLSAPFAGVLIGLPVNVTGVNLTATDVFELVNPATLVFKAAVDETDIGLVKLGQPAQVTFDAFPEDTINSQVSFISYKSQTASGGTVFVVKIPITGENLLNRYRLGMNGDVRIVLETKNNVLTIPLDATRQRENKTYVDVKTGENQVSEREIQLGLETEDKVEVINGLSPDDQVALP